MRTVKVYYCLEFEQLSPLRIGNSIHEESDSDLMLDGRGLPFIPGTSLAGIFRHYIQESGVSEDIINKLFGIIGRDKAGKSISESSSIIFGDAVLDKGVSKDDVIITRRDGIGLTEWGTARKGSKFDFQIAETDGKFYSVIEWTGDEEERGTVIEGIVEPALKHFIANGIRAGARTTRGYGRLKLGVRKRLFEFPQDIDKWIDFDPYDLDLFADAKCLEGALSQSDVKLEVSFKMISSFSVRVNTARTEIADDGTVPDAFPMENYKGNPVIPGTAWAGAFRHHMHALLRDTGVVEGSAEMRSLDELFGLGSDSKSTGKSNISFSETEILINDKAKQKASVMRTALDRFTAAPRTAALFTNMVYYGGTGTLDVTFDKRRVSREQLQLLSDCICDYHLGLASIGGEASVGRGLLQVIGIKCNGKEIKDRMEHCIHGKDHNWLKEEVDNA